MNPIKDAGALFLSEEQIAAYNRRVPELVAALQEGDIHLKAPDPYIFGTDPETIAGSARGRYPAHRPYCYVPYFVAYVDAKYGTVTACNLLPHRRGRPLCMEGLWEKGFAAIWNSPEYRDSRAAFAPVAGTICTGCEPANVDFNVRTHLQFQTRGWTHAHP